MREAPAKLIDVVLAYAGPTQAFVFELRVPEGSTVGAALQACGALSSIPELAGQALDVGIFGRPCGVQEIVHPGDRIEIYRPLTIDPKLARRRRAALKSR